MLDLQCYHEFLQILIKQSVFVSFQERNDAGEILLPGDVNISVNRISK